MAYYLASKSGREIRNGLKKRCKTIGGDRKKNVSDVIGKTKDLVEEAKGRIKK